ncbi:MAG: hypothetical protein JNL90_19650 [Planctomycetes bacterium]|nr:hypothetical protein [Planctomycetota bacterium]
MRTNRSELVSAALAAGTRRASAVAWVTALGAGATLCLTACGGSGGTGSGPAAYARQATLLSVRFPDPNDVNFEAEESAPQNAPVVQTIEFTFSGSPDPNRINATVLPIVDPQNRPVRGHYDVDGAIVTFIPDLPVRPISTLPSGALDNGGAGLEFNTAYTLRAGPLTFAFVAAVDPALLAAYPDATDPAGIYLPFRTMATPTADAFRAIAATAPQLVEVSPLDGATGVSPNFFSDPDGLFAERPVFTLVFDGPLNPDSTNINDTIFELIDLDDRPTIFPDGLPLGIDVELVENAIDRAVVAVRPSGILPFGHLLALQHDLELKGLAENGSPAGGPVVATTFTVAADPSGTLRDALVEDFDGDEREETDIDQIGSGNVLADWDRRDSNVLQAALEFDGDGSIGRFLPNAPATGDTVTIVLDTTEQLFPLLDGSTPDAIPGTRATNGVFHFTDIDIPDGVIIVPQGNNPLVFKASGSVRIAGDILLSGDDGSSEFAYDSSITSIPGGPARAGGGRGGDSHPVTFFPADTINYLTLVSPTFAKTGLGMNPVTGAMEAIGGTGAQSGALDTKDSKGKYQTNDEMGNCDEFRQISTAAKIAGGGGGSMFRAGATPKDTSGNILHGIANVHPDGTGKWILDTTSNTCLAGVGGSHPFAADGTNTNDFFGKLGQLTRLIGGQGGGGGGTQCDSYFCGNWCDIDTDPANDGCCANEDNLPAQGRSPSVGDSRGGGGGGGGGSFMLQALGDITLVSTALIEASGGNGGGGEGIACSYWGGGGGGGAGGMIILQSASTILVESGAVLDVRRGLGDNAAPNNDYADCSNSSNGVAGDGGDGGHGMIQLQVPIGSKATVVNPGTDVNGSVRPIASWVDPNNTLAPVEFTPLSVALSRWHDFGRVIARGPTGTNPVFSFSGLDGSGYVATDGSGNVLSPATTDIVVGYLGQIDTLTGTYAPGEEPRANFVPTNAKVKVEFQGADAIVEGSKEVDPASLTSWSSDVTVANGKQFLRWRITFDTTFDGSPLTPNTRRPIVERIEVHAEF